MSEHMYEDAQRRIEEDALEIYKAQEQRGDITAEDCAHLYFEWIQRYRQPDSPDFKI